MVPTLDRPGLLVECLKALAALEYPRERYEVIVVDDGGRSPLDEVCRGASPGFRVRLERQEHGGPGAARNAGAALASGALLAFTDDDCRPGPTWLHLLARRFAAEPDRGLGGRTLNALPDNPFAATSQTIIDAGYAHANADRRAARFFTSNNLALPASRFREIGGFDPRFRTSEDRDLCERWRARGLGLTYVPEAVVHHAPPLDLRAFVRQHFAYGRGARRFHRERALRNGAGLRVDPAFYLGLHRRALRGASPGRALSLSALLGLWHVVNAAGFAWEAARAGRRG